ncbi:MAG: hypothetical protein OEM41_00660 [Ignavibacteria bacterium]|nr:hypothetical protein [Ignavibacteria bacterium]
MSNSEAVILKGSQLHERVCTLSSFMESVITNQETLVLSFDLYCVLLEYSVLLGKFDVIEKLSVEQLIMYDQLVFDTGSHKLIVNVDFFAPQNSITIS